MFSLLRRKDKTKPLSTPLITSKIECYHQAINKWAMLDRQRWWPLRLVVESLLIVYSCRTVPFREAINKYQHTPVLKVCISTWKRKLIRQSKIEAKYLRKKRSAEREKFDRDAMLTCPNTNLAQCKQTLATTLRLSRTLKMCYSPQIGGWRWRGDTLYTSFPCREPLLRDPYSRAYSFTLTTGWATTEEPREKTDPTGGSAEGYTGNWR